MNGQTPSSLFPSKFSSNLSNLKLSGVLGTQSSRSKPKASILTLDKYEKGLMEMLSEEQQLPTKPSMQSNFTYMPKFFKALNQSGNKN